MARPSATALLLLLVLSLVAVAHCRAIESDPATEAETVAVETGPSNPAVDVVVQNEVGPVEEADGFLRLPSHRGHRHPCRHSLLHRHHGLFHDGGHHRFHRRGEAQLVAVDNGEPAREVKAVAEPDPDQSLHEEAKAVAEPDPDSDGEHDAAVRRWKKEMLWRMFRHHHHHHEDDDHDQEQEGTAGLKRFRHHHDEEDDDEEKEKKVRKLHFLHRHHDEDEEKMGKPFDHHADDSDSDDEEDGELEEMVRQFRKAIRRRRFGHGHRFFRHHWHHGRHHHHHPEAEEAEQQQQQEGGVMTWIRGLMNRF